MDALSWAHVFLTGVAFGMLLGGALSLAAQMSVETAACASAGYDVCAMEIR